MKKRLGDILLERGVVDSLQLQSALAFQRQWGLPLGKVVVDQGFAGAREVFSALEEQTGIPAVDLDSQLLDRRLARLVPVKVAECYRVVPLRLEGTRDSVLVVAIAAPASLDALDVVKSVSGKGRVVPRLATDAAINRAIGRLYRGEVYATPTPAASPGVSLPDADEVMHFMANCMLEDVVIEQELLEDAPVARATTYEQDGLPLLSPLELELEPVSDQLVSVTDTLLGFPALRTASTVARVLIYGWGPEASTGLKRVLGEAGIPARVVSAAEVREAGEDTVVVSPLPAVEALGQRLVARLLVAGKAPEQELKRSQAVGALGFLAAPVDPELLLRAVRRLLRLGNETYLRPN
ncbi:GspE/PulE/PilB domain-containing protein [Hyalangium gracile]|uniref:GspE/PulE/PilB domain-containing protein n=1 Tax=Hyalangium gracile TaxID=394092 RepID=UPI001CD0180B|nr:general secretion pathway protein GspE [Hyalangium gracile]